MDIVYKTILIENRSRPHSGRRMLQCKLQIGPRASPAGRQKRNPHFLCKEASPAGRQKRNPHFLCCTFPLKHRMLQDRDSDLGDRIDKFQKCPDTALPATCATGPGCNDHDSKHPDLHAEPSWHAGCLSNGSCHITSVSIPRSSKYVFVYGTVRRTYSNRP